MDMVALLWSNKAQYPAAAMEEPKRTGVRNNHYNLTGGGTHLLKMT